MQIVDSDNQGKFVADIYSLQNDRVKLINALQSRTRTRRKERKIVLEGTRLIYDALSQGHEAEFILYHPDSINVDDIEMDALLSNQPLFSVTDEIMQQVSDTETPQGIIGVFPMPEPQVPATTDRILILDAVQDPGNMGTILRAAAAAGVQLVVLAPRCVDPYNPKVLRAGMGAHFRVPLVERDWAAVRELTSAAGVYLAMGDGTTRYDTVNWIQPWVLVIGNEAHGIGSHAETLEGEPIYIPMAAETESINAAVAAGVILFEAQRQRLT